MRPALRLATSNIFGRRGRTLLLIAVVTLSAALIAAVITAMGSVEGALRKRMTMMVGTADARIRHIVSGETVDARLWELVASWPEVASAVPRLQHPLTLRVVRPAWNANPPFQREVRVLSSTAMGSSLPPPEHLDLRPIDLVDGRLPQSPQEIVVSQVLLDRLRGKAGIEGRRSTALAQITSRVADGLASRGVPTDIDSRSPRASSSDEAAAWTAEEAQSLGLGSRIEAVRFPRQVVGYTIVGIAKSELLGGRPQTLLTLEGLERTTGEPDRAGDIEIVLKPGFEPGAFVDKYAGPLRALPDGSKLILQTTEKVTTGFKKNIQNNNIPLLIASGLAFLSAAFIITTGMTVSITERKRELAIVRCIGASRWQIAETQLWIGLGIGTIGAVLGVPLGVGIALSLLHYFQNDMKIEVLMPGSRVLIAAGGAIVSALIGAGYPAWRASSLPPLRALSARAEAPPRAGVWWLLLLGVIMIALQPVPLYAGLGIDQTVLLYLWFGLPCLLIGYFLLGVPVLFAMTRIASVAVARSMRLPPVLLRRSMEATPFRNGLTAGAMMTGLALLVAIWTQGRAISEDWLGKIRFPEVFITGTQLKPRHQRELDRLPFVTQTVAITLQAVEAVPLDPNTAPDQTILAMDRTTFIAFEPKPFFSLAKLIFVEGDEVTAAQRLEQGGAILVAREFATARRMGVGSKVRLGYENRWKDFEIVGVVSSPGLDIVNQYFDLGQSFAETAVHAVFGSRADLRDSLLDGAEPNTQLIQVGLVPQSDPAGVDDETADARIRDALSDGGILDVGNGRKLRADITAVLERSMLVVSAIAVMSMLVACLGVANLIIAGIDARQFEFGVLRAVGARRGVVLRLVLAEAFLIGLAAIVLGTCMGLQAVWAGQKIDALLIGIELRVHPPWIAIASGWVVVLVLTVGASAPAVFALGRRSPRELLAAVRG